MQRALLEKPLPLPEPVTAPPRELASEMAVLTPSFERGALLLAAADGRRFGLSWEDEPADDPAFAGADRRRALPAGSYTLVGYRLIAAPLCSPRLRPKATRFSIECGPSGTASRRASSTSFWNCAAQIALAGGPISSGAEAKLAALAQALRLDDAAVKAALDAAPAV